MRRNRFSNLSHTQSFLYMKVFLFIERSNSLKENWKCKMKKIIAIFGLLLLVWFCYTGKGFLRNFFTETTKHMDFKVIVEEDGNEAQKVLVNKGNEIIFEGKTYQIAEKVNQNYLGKQIAFVGQMHYVDQNNKIWNSREIEEVYFYLDAKDIREKNPMYYGGIYTGKGKNTKNQDELYLEINEDIYKILLVKS